MFVPTAIPMGGPAYDYFKRMRQLEQALVKSLDITQALMERLETKFGPDFLGADLKRLMPNVTPAESEYEFDEINRLITEGPKAAAVKHFRETYGVTWDEAQQAVSSWGFHTKADKLRALRLARFIKSSGT